MGLYVLYGILIISSVWDSVTHRIPNALCLIGGISGLIFAFITAGYSGLIKSFISLLVIGISLFSLWALMETLHFSVFGPGDIKLFIAISPFLGIKEALIVLYVSIIVGGFLFLFLISFKSVKNMFNTPVYFLAYGFPLRKTTTETEKKRLPFSFPILIAVFMTQHFSQLLLLM